MNRMWLIGLYGMVICIGGIMGNSQVIGMDQFHGEGKKFAQEFKNNKPKSKDLKDVTGYVGTNVDQARYGEHDLKHKVGGELASSDEGKFLTESNNNRPRFDIDPKTDPLLEGADEYVNNPEEALKVFKVERESGNGDTFKQTTHTCIKGQESFERKCLRRLIPKKTGTRLEEKDYDVNFNVTDFPFLYDGTFTRFSYLDENYVERLEKLLLKAIKAKKKIVDAISNQTIDLNLDHIIKATDMRSIGPFVWQKRAKLYTTAYYQVKLTSSVKIHTYELEWVDDCNTLEEVMDREDCDYGESRCVEGKSTKIIEGVSLTADCWAEERIYRCHGNKKDTCQEYVKKGCSQISSQCKTFEGKECIEWEQTYQCDEGNRGLSSVTLSGDKPYCMDGDCTDQSWAPNQDMADALSKLAIFQNIKKNMDKETQTVFGGKVKKCSRLVTNFKDCCKKNGWGVDIGLSSCKPKEKELAEFRKRHKCVQVGTPYCSEKGKLGICLKKKTSFCCYPSKLARIINEQGKDQLGLSFGTGRHPKCEGLTLEQLTKLDFARIDLSELFQDAVAQIKIPNGDKIKEEIQKSMDNKTFSYTDKSKNITQGRSHENF